jgi:hypothetical protein
MSLVSLTKEGEIKKVETTSSAIWIIEKDRSNYDMGEHF